MPQRNSPTTSRVTPCRSQSLTCRAVAPLLTSLDPSAYPADLRTRALDALVDARDAFRDPSMPATVVEHLRHLVLTEGAVACAQACVVWARELLDAWDRANPDRPSATEFDDPLAATLFNAHDGSEPRTAADVPERARWFAQVVHAVDRGDLARVNRFVMRLGANPNIAGYYVASMLQITAGNIHKGLSGGRVGWVEL